ncbi:Isoprenylcysteine carboxyl methyltransferase family-domain-containing protein [Syncephalis fuscata]|nr:Isoprenylcysteine carboxyl methyltransferase family-domain-containing protein [Syncephalis fuscata]
MSATMQQQQQQQPSTAPKVDPAHSNHAHIQHLNNVNTAQRPEFLTYLNLNTEKDESTEWSLLKHSPQNVAFYSFCLGALFMISIEFFIHSTLPSQLSVYLAALSLFHFLEYFSTALWNTSKVNLDSFLIDHSTAYHMANGAGIIEFTVEYLLTPEWKHIGWIFIVIIGQVARTLAMATAGRSFNHQVQSRRQSDHQLITHGIYGWMRHPSYFGFYFWALGTQLMLANPFSFIAFLFVLHRFFADRVAYEERALLRFFGQDYYAYKQRVGTMMPFIRGC